MLYYIRNFVNDQTLVMLYYSFAYGRFTYGITAWGTAAQNQLHEIEVKLNNIVRTLTWNTKFFHVTKLYKKLDFLKLHDVYKLELAKFMHKLFNNKPSNSCDYDFSTIEKIHNYETRKPSRSNYFSPRVSKSARQKKVTFRCVKLCNEISENLKNKPFNSFKKQLNENLIREH